MAREAEDLDLQVMALRGLTGTNPVAAAHALEAMDVVDCKLLEVFEETAAEQDAWDRFLRLSP